MLNADAVKFAEVFYTDGEISHKSDRRRMTADRLEINQTVDG